MKQWLIKRIKKLFENIESTITTVIVLALLSSSIGILALSKKALNFFLQIVNIPTPLWATIVLVLLVIVYIKMKKSPSSPASPASNYIIKYFTIGKFKWETKIYDGGYFEIEKYPYCVTHDLKYIFGNHRKYCPGPENQKCNNSLNEYDEFEVYESAKSIIENKIRNKKY